MEAEEKNPKDLDLGPLPNFLGYVLRRAQTAVLDDFVVTMAPLGLRVSSLGVMAVIKANPGSSQTAISDALGLQQTNLVATINALEKRNLVKRTRIKQDRRSYSLYLTDEGIRVLDEALALQARHEARFLEKLGPDGKGQLMSLLSRLLGD